MSSEPWQPEQSAAGAGFVTTRWSVVLSAAAEAGAARDKALEELCRAYWYPVYSFLRRRGYDRHAAQDLTQGFFARFLEHNDVSSANAARGRFRTFLLACAQHFVANEWDRQNALKRGGAARIISLDEEGADERYRAELVTQATPEHAYEQRWVEAVLEAVLRRLKDEFAAAGKAEQFDALKIYLVEDRGETSFAEMAQNLGVTEPAVKGVVRRMRQRYRDLFRQEVANTVAHAGDVEEEIRHLISVLGGK